jgi:hypothetical protein
MRPFMRGWYSTLSLVLDCFRKYVVAICKFYKLYDELWGGRCWWRSSYR